MYTGDKITQDITNMKKRNTRTTIGVNKKTKEELKRAKKRTHRENLTDNEFISYLISEKASKEEMLHKGINHTKILSPEELHSILYLHEICCLRYWHRPLSMKKRERIKKEANSIKNEGIKKIAKIIAKGEKNENDTSKVR